MSPRGSPRHHAFLMIGAEHLSYRETALFPVPLPAWGGLRVGPDRAQRNWVTTYGYRTHGRDGVDIMMPSHTIHTHKSPRPLVVPTSPKDEVRYHLGSDDPVLMNEEAVTNSLARLILYSRVNGSVLAPIATPHLYHSAFPLLIDFWPTHLLTRRHLRMTRKFCLKAYSTYLLKREIGLVGRLMVSKSITNSTAMRPGHMFRAVRIARRHP